MSASVGFVLLGGVSVAGSSELLEVWQCEECGALVGDEEGRQQHVEHHFALEPHWLRVLRRLARP